MTSWATLQLLWSTTTLRHWRRAPRQTALLVTIIALGVAVYFSIRLANRAAVASFSNFTELVTEESDWILTAASGDLPESALDEARKALGDQAVDLFPVLESTATRLRSRPDESIGERMTFTLLGVDLIAVQNAAAQRRMDRSWFGQAVTNASVPANPLTSFWNVFTNPASVFIPESRARADGLSVGDPLRLLINDAEVQLQIAGIIPTMTQGPNPPDSLLIMDLPALQRATSRTARLDRIEFRAAPGPRQSARRDAIREAIGPLNPAWRIITPSERREAGATMTRAFRLNLTILSLLALLVGLYLVFQALDGAVVRRREEIGILRSLGVTPGAIRSAWLVEAVVLGIAGGAIGAVLGWAGAQGAVRMVGRTVNALYYATSAESASLSWIELAGAIALAVTASVVAGWFPAGNAAATPPAQILVRNAVAPASRGPWLNPWAGAALCAIATGLSFMGPLRFEGGFRLPAAGYLAALLSVLGAGMMAGGILGAAARISTPWAGYSASLHLALSHLRKPSGRHRLAAAGLLCAVAMTAGMAILVASFESTMRGWIERTFQADLYISSDGAQTASTQNRIPESTWKDIVTSGEIADWNVIQATSLHLPAGETILVGAGLDFSRRHAPLAWRDPPQDDALWDPARNAGLALVSEAFSLRFGIGRGAPLEIPTPAGIQRVTIAGVFCDYGNERGSVVVEREHFVRWQGHTMATSLILKLKPSVTDSATRSRILQRHPGLQILTNAHLRREVLRVFRQTFAITYALEFIGVAVAVAGLGMTLAAVLLERRSELTTLRALGMSHREIARGTALEGAALALAGGGGGLIVSLGLGGLLIFVINRQTFGWTLQYTVPSPLLASLLALVVASGTGVAYVVGRWGAALPADREE